MYQGSDMKKARINEEDIEKFRKQGREHEKLIRVMDAERRKPEMLSCGKGKKTKNWQC